MTDVGSAQIEVKGDVRNFARNAQRDLDRALSQIKTPTIDVKADVDVDRDRLGSSFTTAGKEAAGALTDALGKGLSGLSGMLGSNPYVAAAGVALAAAVVATFLPAIGALLAGAVISLSGISVIGLGAALLKDEPQVKGAAKKLKTAFDETFSADSASPLIGPLTEAMQTLAQVLEDIRPDVEAIFTSLGNSGAIEAVARGIGMFVDQAMPGFKKLVETAGPFLKEVGPYLGVIGAALGRFFESIAAGAPGATQFFKDLALVVAGAIIILGQIIQWLSNAYLSVRQFFVSAVAAVTSAWSSIKGAVSSGINAVKSTISSVLGAIKSAWTATWDAVRTFLSNVWSGIRSTVSGAINAVRSTISSVISSIKSTWSSGWTALVTVVTNIIGRVKSAVGRIKDAVMSVFSGAGTWLRDAGGRIIDGLIAGIRAGFGRVQSLLGSLTAMLPDWKGPAEVDQKILRDSGRMVMSGFEAGLTDQFASVRKTLAAMTSEIPGWTAGISRGGDGVSAAAPIQFGDLHVHVSGATGEEAGQRAAEQILLRLGQAAATGL